jgi:4-cresol dehydrogenase (hydroxylating) flavoprotein subunit
VSGAFYGPSIDALEPMVGRARDVIEATGKARYISHEEIVRDLVFKVRLDTFSGEPTESELGLLDWRPGGGATWLLPATPMDGEIAQQHQELSRRILADHGFEYLVEFVCGPRAARALHIIVYNRADDAERRRMLSGALRGLIAVAEAYPHVAASRYASRLASRLGQVRLTAIRRNGRCGCAWTRAG